MVAFHFFLADRSCQELASRRLLSPKLGRCIGVFLRWQTRVHIRQLELIGAAVSAPDYIVSCRFRFASHGPNAHTAYVSAATVRYQDMIEVPQTHRAVILVDIALCWVELVNKRDRFFGNRGFDSHFVTGSDLLYFLLLMSMGGRQLNHLLRSLIVVAKHSQGEKN